MTKVQALAILGNPEPELGSVKRAYRKAARKYHPDHGGDLRQMQLVNDAWELLKKVVKEAASGKEPWGEWHYAKADESTPLTEEIKEIYDKLKHLPQITIELCGTWLWIGGETLPVKETLLGIDGIFYAPKKKKWYWKPKDYKKFGKKTYSMGQIRDFFGSKELDKDEHTQVG